MNIEDEIREDIDALRATITNTQELYREVCALLFFRYGITPTANKLYQLVKKGSMSAPAEALARFWEQLREKSRVRIEHPDLPDSLKTAAGELVGRLWADAQAEAQETLSVFRHEADARVAEADAARQNAESDQQAAINELERLHEALDVAAERNLALERSLAAERAQTESLRAQSVLANERLETLETALAGARQAFSIELEKLRDSLRIAENRFETSEKRGLLEIDRERTMATKAQKELAQERKTGADLIERQRNEYAALQRELGDVRQKLGVAEGSLAKMRELAEQQTTRLEAMREQLALRTTEAALMQREVELRDEQLKAVEKSLLEAKQAAHPAGVGAPRKGRGRKSSPPSPTTSTETVPSPPLPIE
jgi:DNA repair exonuclease SbcCD ATPase subunit